MVNIKKRINIFVHHYFAVIKKQIIVDGNQEFTNRLNGIAVCVLPI